MGIILDYEKYEKMRKAEFFEKEGEYVRCLLCPHKCRIGEEKTGACSARRNRNGTLFTENYGRISSIALDPIEKKPFHRFFPGAKILSVGSYGCNMTCAFCQNYSISQMTPPLTFMGPEELAQTALSVPRNVGVAFTYNEPLIGIEYIMDAAPLIHQAGLKVALVTNGMILEDPLSAILPLVDAMNIDLKAFSTDFYEKHNGSLETVKRTIETCARTCHVEVTTLVIPGENDGLDEMDALAAWLSAVSPDIPLHATRFFPRYKMSEKEPTDREKIFELVSVARGRLKHVYAGNL
ncbi:MAG: AmmeMemoRadiSam system radical SAM enzyme [Treponema sp.]|jgi:pyruvate formate lyase activating enzyme|nr:AmmeMemoRadiSam system radical SAM enzyme [Treponema sp.]